jgi:single-stranded DNA-binding protein
MPSTTCAVVVARRVAEVAHWLNTPLTAFEDMDWSEVVLWHAEARRLARAAKMR